MLFQQRHFAWLILPAVLLAECAFAKGAKSFLYEVDVRQIRQAPVLDGILSKNEWKAAALVNNFTQKEPVEGARASEPTFVLITYDDSNIYFGIRCFDNDPRRIVANEMRRDYDLSENDYFEIIIDTFHDQRNAYYFATNSLGARLDSEIKAEGEHVNWDWDGIWNSAAKKDKYGWTAEVAIPFQTLRFQNADALTWGINFGRYIPRKREEAFWSPISRDDDYDAFGKFRVSKFGTLRGLKNVNQEQRVQIKPYTIGGVEKNFATGNSVQRETDLGLDAKIRLTSNIVSDLTVNTDFAQVEADQEEVNLSRFSLFFPEKRDFFIEGLDVFNVGENTFSDPFTLLFFSRKIGLHRDVETSELKETPIIGGAKVTGKEGKYEIGFLNVLTDNVKYTNLNGSNVQIPETNYSAFRIKRDIFKRSSIGFLGLSRDPLGGGDYNRTFAADGTFSFFDNLKLNGYLAKTVTPGLKGKDYNGFLEASWGSDLYFARGSFTDIGANFNPEMGFLQWTDIRKYDLQLTVSPRPKFFNSRKTHLSYDIEVITNHDNELQFRTFQPSILNIFKDESFFFLGWTNYYDNIPAPGFFLGPAFIPGGIYRYNVIGTSYSSDLSKKVAGGIRFGGGSFYDGTFAGLTLSNYIRPSDKIALDFTWNWNRVDVPFDNGKFTTSIVGARFNYSFTPNLFVKTYVQWNNFEKKIVSNILLNYIHSLGSDLFLVYNEEWDTSGSLNTLNRTLLAKFTYGLNL